MRAVNLLPRDDGEGGRLAPPISVLAACVGLVIVSAILAVMFLSASTKVANHRKALQQAQTQYAAIPTPAPPPEIASKLPDEQKTRVSALATALGQRIAWDRVLREVSQVVPSDVWLATLDATSPLLDASTLPGASASPGTLPTGFVITGCTYSQDSVARFLARLDLVPDLTQMTLGKSAAGTGSTSGASAAGNTCPNAMFTFTLQGNIQISAGAA